MAKKDKRDSAYVKKDTMLVVAFVALTVGFLGGIVFHIYKSGSGIQGPVSQSQEQSVQSQGASEEAINQIPFLEQETKRDPGNAEAWVRLGNLYFDSNSYTKAIAAYQKALSLKHGNANVWTDLGVMYRRNGEPARAIEAFDEAIKVDPRHEIAWFNKGVVLMHDLHDQKGAIRAWEGLLKVNPFAKAPNGQPVLELLEKLKETSKKPS
jgi:cytochrome c-type biogenesis protein CcmH/NrfG